MTRRVLLTTSTYRTFEYHYGLGLLSLFPGRTPEIQARLDALDVEIIAGAARGYGAGRNYGQQLVAGIQNGADLSLTIDSDIAWTADHVVSILEAEKFLRTAQGGSVVVGGIYPESNRPEVLTMFQIAPDGRRLRWEDQNIDDVSARLITATELARQGVVDDFRRYMAAWLVPAGFALWPLAVYREKAWEIEDRSSASLVRYFDNAMCEHALECGVPIYADLGLDVGHMPIAPVTAVGQARLYAGRS